MEENKKIKGVVTAVLTPIDHSGKPDPRRLAEHIHRLEEDGTDAVLIAGTTGEGPSLSVLEREALLKTGLEAAGKMQVIAQTGCASLTDTLHLTRHAFTLGLNTVTILPPFFFKGVSDDGLYAFYQWILDEAVPPHGKIILYHIPQVTQVPISIRLVERLLETNPDRIAGIKDSAGDLDHLQKYCQAFPQLSVLTGNDQLILAGLRIGAAGCVTGVVNVFSAMAAAIIKAYRQDEPAAESLQQKFTAVWRVLEGYQPYTTLLKGLLALRYDDPGWLRVRPPLDSMPLAQLHQMIVELSRIELPPSFDWIHQTDLAGLKRLERIV